MKRLLDWVEMHFDCELGPARAFFEVPQRSGDPVRIVYHTYVVRGDKLDDLIEWMLDNVFRPLARETKHEGLLYWRLPDCFEVQMIDDEYYLRTRIAVRSRDDLDRDISSPARKPEGQPVPRA